MKITLNNALLKKKRTESGKTRDDLLVDLKKQGIPVSAHTLTDWEQGKKTPKQIQLLFGIADVLDFDVKEIILIEEDADEDNRNPDTPVNPPVPGTQENQTGSRF